MSGGASSQRFARFRRTSGDEGAGLLEDDRVAVVQEPFWHAVQRTGETLALEDVELLAPCSPRVAIGVGLNYFSHLANRPAPDPPALYLLSGASLCGPGDPIVLPHGAHRVTPEGEVVAVIGQVLRRASLAEAERGIFGFTAGNDVTVRDWLRAPGDWWRAKGSDNCSPFGPCIATGLDPRDLTVTTRIGGEVVQDGATADLVRPVAEIVAYVSTYATLRPGDLVFTGTPGLVGPLAAGDVVEVEIDGVGVLRNPVVAAS